MHWKQYVASCEWEIETDDIKKKTRNVVESKCTHEVVFGCLDAVTSHEDKTSVETQTIHTCVVFYPKKEKKNRCKWK